MRLIDLYHLACDERAPVQPKYAIVWEDPEQIDEPAKVTVPAPEWLVCAIAGGVLPPVEVFHIIEDTMLDGRVTMGHLLHERQIGPMTEEEAMEYLLQKDVPRRVWQDTSSNRLRYKIVPRELIPTNRAFRNAWRLKIDG